MTKGLATEELRRRILNAFQGNVYPGDDKLTSSSGWEEERIAHILKGKKWSELHGSDFVGSSSGLPLLRNEALCYYLPALLLNALDDRSSPTYNSLLVEFTFYILEKDGADESTWTSGLSQTQRQVVLDFLLYYTISSPEEFDDNIVGDMAKNLVDYWFKIVGNTD